MIGSAGIFVHTSMTGTSVPSRNPSNQSTASSRPSTTLTWHPASATSTSSSTSSASYTIADSALAEGVDTNYQPINRTQTFDANDTYAHSWIKLINVYSPSHNISWTWLTPWGQAYAKYNVTIPDPGSGRYYQNYYADSSISIKGSSALYLAGAWHVNVYIDGALALLQNFSLESPYLTPQGIRSA